MADGESKIVGDAEYLKALSGRKQRSAVASWCRDKGIKYMLNADGWPVTTPAALDRAVTKAVKRGPHWEIFDDEEETTAQSP
jgi:hypothetical protein